MDSNSWPRVTQILAATGVADFSQIPNAEFYLQRGQDVHLACADINRGDVPDYWTGSEIEGFCVAWQSFLQETRFKPTHTEYSVVNPTHRYRGTLDDLGYFGDNTDRVLLDVKGGIVAEWVKLQTAAYAACLSDPHKIRRFGVQLSAKGKYAISPEYKDFRVDSQYFFALAATVHGRTLYGKAHLLED